MSSSNPRAVRKNKIMEAALAIFAEKGFQDTTISEISKAANVSEGTLYEYFKTKEDLLFAIPGDITEKAYQNWLFVLSFIKGTESKIRAMIHGYMKLYSENPQYAALIMLQLKSNRNFIKTEAYQRVRDVSGHLLGIIQEGIDCGDFRKDTDAMLVRSMILGTIDHLCVRWLLLGKSSDLFSVTEPLMEHIFNGIREKKVDETPVIRLVCPNAKETGE